MKFILTALFTTLLFISCTNDETFDDVQNNTAINLSKNLQLFDNSNEGLYKGVFTTNDSEQRGILVLKIKDNTAQATLLLINGKKISYTGNITDDGIFFSGASLSSVSSSSFKFTVEANGDNPSITEATYNNVASSFLIAKETSYGPVVPMSGAISCFDCDITHPSMDTGNTGTFNLLFAGDGTGIDTVTAMVDVGVMVTLTGIQDNCSGAGTVTCNLSGSDVVGNNTINWSGTHSYTELGDCSEGAGTWTLSSTLNGDSNGTWISDAVCQNKGLEFDETVPERVKYTTSNGDILDSQLNGATDYTIEMWVKPTTADIHNNVIIKRWNQFAITLYDNERFYFTRYGATNKFVNTLHNVVTINQWNHLAVICNSANNTIKLYVNGIDVTNDTDTATDVVLASSPASSNLYLGYGGSGTYFTGNIDKVRIQNRAEDIANLNTSDVSGTPYTADAYTALLYNFNEGTGYNTINEADATLNNTLQCNAGTCDGSENWWVNL